MRIFQQRRQR